MKKIFLYSLVGFIFAAFDMFYATATNTIFDNIFQNSSFIYMLIACAVWLIPIVPMYFIEYNRGTTKFHIYLITLLIWNTSLLSYYGFWIPFKLIFIGQKSMYHLHISNYNTPYYWENIISFIRGSIAGMPEWTIFSIITGFILTYTVFYLIDRKR